MTGREWPPSTPEAAEAHLAALEARVMAPYYTEVTSIVRVSVERSRKRDGATLRRGKAYVRLVYSRLRRPGGAWEYEPITREQAISEIMLSPELRRARDELENVRLCDGCGALGEGDENREHWQRVVHHVSKGIRRSPGIGYVGPDGKYERGIGRLEPTYRRTVLDICTTCIERIAAGALRL